MEGCVEGRIVKTLSKHHEELRKANDELKDEVRRDAFLAEWLAEIEAYKPIFHAEVQGMSSDDRERVAHERGFRTWRLYSEAVDAANKLVHDYVYHPSFKRLWTALKEYDKSFGWVDRYGPHNGGVPRQLMETVVDWYRLPKLTASERWKLQQRVAVLCDELLICIGQLSPAPVGEDPFGSIKVPAVQAEKLMRNLGVPEDLLVVPSDRPPWLLSSVATRALTMAGIDAAWYVGQLKEAANVRPMARSAPRKINAKSAYRTYLIQQVYALICPHGTNRMSSKYRLVADVVEALTGDLCTEEDVRKQVPRITAEDLLK